MITARAALVPLITILLPIARAQTSDPADSFSRDQRMQWFVHRTFDWHRMLYLAADTGFDHLLGAPDDWGEGADRFARRYGHGFGRRVIRNSMELGLGIALREDIRYRPSHTGSLKGRLRYAVISSVYAPVRGGRSRPTYSRFAAAFGTELMATRWYPYPVSAGDIFRNGSLSLLDQVGNNCLSEFEPELKHFGRRVGGALWRALR